ncbi:hypothetical protein LTR33_009611, partial [Friedmanniomyces endolithicus]
MARADDYASEESHRLVDSTGSGDHDDRHHDPRVSASSASSTSLVLEHISDKGAKEMLYTRGQPRGELDMGEEDLAWKRQTKPSERKLRRIFYVMIAIGAIGWVAALFLFL